MAAENWQSSHEMLLEVLNSLGEVVTITDIKTYEILFINKYGENIFGKITGGKCWQILQKGQSGPCTFCNNKHLLDSSGQPTGVLNRESRNTVNGHWYHIHERAMPWINGHMVKLGTALDITTRKKTEEKIQEALKEKDLLLKEVHHRVKNNMQLISSLLDLQASCGNDEAAEILKGSQSKIRSMAIIHEKLYNSRDMAKIDFGDYLIDMTEELQRFYMGYADNPVIKIKTNGVRLGIDKAIPCGLILNELISNALKHAFPDKRQGEIRVFLRTIKEREIEICVSDNGQGLPENIDPCQTKSVGLYLVNGLVKNQLHGELEVKRKNGTEFRMKITL